MTLFRPEVRHSSYNDLILANVKFASLLPSRFSTVGGTFQVNPMAEDYSATSRARGHGIQDLT